MAATEANSVTLIETTDEDFAWMMGEGPAPAAALRLPRGGVEPPDVLNIVRGMAARLRAIRNGGNWMIVVDSEVVGLCSYKKAPDADGTVDIGYGIAEDHRNQGFATRAVAAILGYAKDDPSVHAVSAATALANIASQRVLERNGFSRIGTRLDPEDGEVILWRRDFH
jgi:RimJ/RimL family protein N-acetyltransferase